MNLGDYLGSLPPFGLLVILLLAFEPASLKLAWVCCHTVEEKEQIPSLLNKCHQQWGGSLGKLIPRKRLKEIKLEMLPGSTFGALVYFSTI